MSTLLDDEKLPGVTKSAALAHLFRFASPEQAIPLIRKTLERPALDFDPLTWAAIEGAQRLKTRESLPVLKQLAVSEKIDQNARCKAVDAIVAQAGKKEAEDVILNLLQPSTHWPVQMHAMKRAAQNNMRAAVPNLLNILDVPDGIGRWDAEMALRVLARQPDGIGSDPPNFAAAAWRKWWAKKK